MAGIEEDISDTEQLPVPSPKEINLMMASGTPSRRLLGRLCTSLAYLTRSYIDLTYIT